MIDMLKLRSLVERAELFDTLPKDQQHSFNCDYVNVNWTCTCYRHEEYLAALMEEVIEIVKRNEG